MDSFFASVEVLDDPTLAGKPVIVGGAGARGVVASCTYEARAFGVRSAMPSVRARQLCPTAIFLDGRYSRYAEVSHRLHEVLTAVTPMVEPIGLDEAFLDVRGVVRLWGEPRQIAVRVRESVAEELCLDCSVGVGRTKMVAKLASRAAKPRADRAGKVPGRGVVVVEPEGELDFLHPMAVEALWGVGPATAGRLHGLGVRTVGDLARLPPEVLVRRLGRAHGTHLAALARGEDHDPVVPDRAAKSIGHEETFRHDIADRAVLAAHVARMAESVASVLRAGGQAARTVTLKVKYADFSLVSRSHTMPGVLDTGKAIAAVGVALAEGLDLRTGVRLLGVSVSGLVSGAGARQLTFDLAADRAPTDPGDPAGTAAALRSLDAAQRQETWEEVMAAVDAVRGRFGVRAVGTVSTVGADGIVVPARRDAPWGPASGGDGR